MVPRCQVGRQFGHPFIFCEFPIEVVIHPFLDDLFDKLEVWVEAVKLLEVDGGPELGLRVQCREEAVKVVVVML